MENEFFEMCRGPRHEFQCTYKIKFKKATTFSFVHNFNPHKNENQSFEANAYELIVEIYLKTNLLTITSKWIFQFNPTQLS